MTNLINEIYFPFEKDVLLNHFSNEKHLDYYLERIEKYNNFLSKNINRLGMSMEALKKPCQVDKGI